MNYTGNLVDTLKDYSAAAVDKPSLIAYLAFYPGKARWGWYNGGDVNSVWEVLNNPTIVIVLRLEPIAALAAIAADPMEAFEAALSRFATFIVTRPAHIGLHHFIDAPVPQHITDENGARDAEDAK